MWGELMRAFIGFPLLACALFTAPAINAASVTYYFSGVVTGISCAIQGCGDPSLVGSGAAAVGTRFSGQFNFDSSWAPYYVGVADRSYASPSGSSAFGAAIALGEINFSFPGVTLQINQPPASPLFFASTPSNTGNSGSNPLAYGNWLIQLLAFGSWGDGTTNLPSTVPLLSQFSGPNTFKLAAFENGPQEATRYAEYFGTIDYLGDTPARVAETPLPPAITLYATGLGAMSLLAWRRRRRATHNGPSRPSS
jgi:hypothetical protein